MYYCDLQSGLEAVEVLRKRGFRNMVVGVTGNVLEDEVAQFLNAGADLVFGKPLRMPALMALLKFVRENGPESQPHMAMKIQADELLWGH